MEKRWFAITLTVATAAIAVLILFWLMGDISSGISTPALAAPYSLTVTVVDPSAAPNDLDTHIMITGTGFTAVPTVTLGTIVLEDIGWVSAEQLTATVPWGLNAGVYTLTVTNPGGGMGSLPNAFTVTQGFGVWNSGGPYGGDIVGLVMNPVTPTTLFAFAHDAGIFASYDGAAHWQQILLDGWPNLLVFDAEDPQVMYFGSKDHLLRTVNGGSDWELVSPEFHSNLYPAAHPTTSGVIYVGSSNPPGLFLSDDFGDTWVTRTNGLTDTNVLAIAFHPDDSNRMLAGTQGGNVFLSTDGGNNWDWKAKVSTHIERLYFNPFGAHEAWATSEVLQGTHYYPPDYLYKSGDPELEVWIPVDVASGNVVRSLTFLTDTIWLAGGEGFTSTNGGASWTPVSSAGLEAGWREGTSAFAIDPGNPDVVYAGNHGHAMFKSSDGGATWSKTNEGLAAVVPRGLAVTPADIDTIYAETFSLGILKSSNGGQTWMSLGIGDGGYRKPLAVDHNIPARVYMGDQDSGQMRLQISEDAGDTWHEVTTTLPVRWSGWKADILEIAPHPNIPGAILAGARFLKSYSQADADTEHGAIYTSNDYGEHWEYAGPTQPISAVVELAYDAIDTNLVYAATKGTGLWKSVDGGASWGEVTSFPGGPIIWTVVTHPDNPDIVYVRGEDPLQPGAPAYISRDAGETWEELPTCINSNRLLFAPSERGKPSYTLYTTAWSQPNYSGSNWPVGLYRSMDGGYNWEQVPGAPATDFHSVAVGSDEERVVVYVGISGGFVSSQSRTNAAVDVFPGRGEIIPSGVYRWGNWLNPPLYFPLVMKAYAP